jgi:hypothetical protein
MTDNLLNWWGSPHLRERCDPFEFGIPSWHKSGMAKRPFKNPQFWMLVYLVGVLGLSAFARFEHGRATHSGEGLDSLPLVYQVPAKILVILVFIVGPFVGWLAVLRMRKDN